MKRGKPLKKTSPSPRRKEELKADGLWSECVKVRDNFTCQWPGCPALGAELNSCHVFTRSIKHMRHLLANGICLCEYCHDWSHLNVKAFRDWLMGWMGKKRFEALKLSAGITQKPDYAMSIVALKAWLKENKS